MRQQDSILSNTMTSDWKKGLSPRARARIQVPLPPHEQVNNSQNKSGNIDEMLKHVTPSKLQNFLTNQMPSHQPDEEE